MPWRWTDYGQYVEVMPTDDPKEHWAGDECWCNPKIEQDEKMDRPLISHNHSEGKE